MLPFGLKIVKIITERQAITHSNFQRATFFSNSCNPYFGIFVNTKTKSVLTTADMKKKQIKGWKKNPERDTKKETIVHTSTFFNKKITN